MIPTSMDSLFKYQFYMEPIVKEHLNMIGKHYGTQTSITIRDLIEEEYNRIYNTDAGASHNGSTK